jgi:hypothetical protein
MPSLTQITAAATCNATRPLSILPMAGGRVYAVNGVQRGFAYIASTSSGTVYPIGITAAPAITASTSASPLFYYVSSVEVTDGGQNYFAPPTVTIGGVTGARAALAGSAVGRVSFLTSATTHTTPPQVVLSGGQASGAAATAVLEATVTGVQIVYGSGAYATPPTVTFYANAGVTETRAAKGYGVINVAAGATSGPLSGIVLTDSGEYRYTSALAARQKPVGAVVSGPIAGVTPGIDVQSTAVVDSVTVSKAGTNYASPPQVLFSSRGLQRAGGGAAAVAAVSSGGVTSVTLTNFGSGYDGSVAVEFANAPAQASAVMAPRLAGKYLCGVRYIDAAGQPGNLCQLVTVDCGDGASTIQWNLSSLTFTDGSPNRVAKAELWRTSGDQAVTLYRVAEVSPGTTSYADALPDATLVDASRTGYGELPIITADGYPNAYRFGVPPSHMSSICMFADRAWYAVDESGAEPNALYFSAEGEQESVPATNQVIIQSVGREADRITGMFPMDGALYVCQQRSITRLTVSGNPLENAAAQQVAQRGLLNDRCWVLHEGVAYVADSTGMYAFDGSSTKPLSDPVKEFWTDPRMDFTKFRDFFVSLDSDQQVVRLHYPVTTAAIDWRQGSYIALCYSLVTQAWWEERYASHMGCVATAYKNGRPENYGGGIQAIYQLNTGNTDLGSGINYSLKTGNFPLNNDPKRGLRLVYTPTSTTHTLRASVYYSGSTAAQPFAVGTDLGTGFATVAGSTQAQLNLSRNTSGFAQLSLAGRLDDRSSGTQRHIAIGLSGTQGALAKPVIHTLQVEGAG